jgi:hypothetical protein
VTRKGTTVATIAFVAGRMNGSEVLGEGDKSVDDLWTVGPIISINRKSFFFFGSLDRGDKARMKRRGRGTTTGYIMF